MDTFVFITEEYPPDYRWGGISAYTETIARAATALGHRAVVVTRASGDHDEESDTDGVHEIRLACGANTARFIPAQFARVLRNAASRLGAPARSLSDRMAFAGAASSKVRELIENDGVRAIEAPDWGAAALGLSIGRHTPPYAVHLHTPTVLVEEMNETPLLRRGAILAGLERMAIRRAALLISPSQELADRICARFGLDPEKVHVVPYPFRGERFAGIAPPEYRGDFRPRILCPGRLEWRKGQDILVRAIPAIAANFGGGSVRLAGRDTTTGPRGTSMRAHLEDLAASLGVSDAVEFAGEVAPDRMPAEYEWADLVVIPSRYDNSPYACLEAQASARPVLAAACGGLPEMVVDGENGALFAPGDSRALSVRAIEVLSDVPLRQRLGRRARRHVLGHNDDTTITRCTLEVLTAMPPPARRA